MIFTYEYEFNFHTAAAQPRLIWRSPLFLLLLLIIFLLTYYYENIGSYHEKEQFKSDAQDDECARTDCVV